MPSSPSTTIVIATRNRSGRLDETLRRLCALPERSPIIVVDNASEDDTAARARAAGEGVTVIRLPENIGAAARNIGVATATTELVAFADDDSWWAPGALVRAEAAFGEHPRLGLIAARVLVGAEEEDDPVNHLMAHSPLPLCADLPGRSVLGFVACGSIVRKEAFLRAGGFEPRYLVGGEEAPLALDLAAAGWGVAYLPEVIAHHHPEAADGRSGRPARQLRNDLWTAWRRRSRRAAVTQTARALWRALVDADARDGLIDAVSGAPWALADRRPVPSEVERLCRQLDASRPAPD